MIKNILVVGSTGKQGGALVQYLANNPSFRLHALTRSRASPGAQKLASNKRIVLIEGSSKQPESIFREKGPFWGVFSVTVPGSDEEAQAMALIEESAKRGVSHFIFTSADRGGPVKSETNTTDVPHFKTKYNIEKHLQAVCARSSMRYTILRPTAFYENLSPNFLGKMFGRTLVYLNSVPLNMVSASDVGIIAGKVMEDPEKHKNRSYSLAADQMTASKISAILDKVLGYPLPTAPAFLESFARLVIGDYGKMVEFFKQGNYSWDPKPNVIDIDHRFMSFEEWLIKSKSVS